MLAHASPRFVVASLAVCSTLAKLLSHPAAYLFRRALAIDSTSESVVVFVFLEIGVTCVETIIYRLGLRCTWENALVFAITANAISALASTFLHFSR